ncbi:MAG: NPCBM/NEW2 domain-containing protein, partial [Phycisphaerae bacterium]|nr:NPCBM/NEW2 domain-containing protein [Phycisphaerae bacterium]
GQPRIPLQITAETISPMVPVRLRPRDSERIVHAALGPIAGTHFDGLFDGDRDWAIWLAGGRCFYEDMGNHVRLHISLSGEANRRDNILTLKDEPDFLKRTHGLSGYVPMNPRRIEPMPAAWMPISGSASSDEIARNTAWMAVNLRPYGAASVLVPTSNGASINPTATADPSAVMKASTTTKSSSIDGSVYLQQLAATIISPFWGQGFVAQTSSSSAIVGESLTLLQARRAATLLALSGRSPIAGESMYRLNEERTKLLGRMIPTAPIRAVDLFSHTGWPAIWNLAVATEAGHCNVVSLFNTTDEPRIETVELEELGISDGERFAVYDFWENKLLRVVSDRFSSCVPANDCRLLSITAIRDNEPTVLGSNRHITCGAMDLYDVHWDAAQQTLNGRSNVAAFDPYELWIYMPDGGNNSLEIQEVRSTARKTWVRQTDHLRTVTFEADTSGPISWTISFRQTTGAVLVKLEPPRNLQPQQNTRGVYLSWYQPDDRAVAHRIYRNGRLLAEVEDYEYQDSTALYNSLYEYTVSTVDAANRESAHSKSVFYKTPMPASVNLTQLMPLIVSPGGEQKLGLDRSAAGTPLRIGNQRVYRGIGTTSPSRIVYFLGGGYEGFSGGVGIDACSQDQGVHGANGASGAAIFRIVADGQTLFTSPVMKANQPPVPFSVRVTGKVQLELIVTDAETGTGTGTGTGTTPTYADWGNAYLRAASPSTASPSATSPPAVSPSAAPPPEVPSPEIPPATPVPSSP